MVKTSSTWPTNNNLVDKSTLQEDKKTNANSPKHPNTHHAMDAEFCPRCCFVFLTPDSLSFLVPSAFGLHRRFPRRSRERSSMRPSPEKPNPASGFRRFQPTRVLESGRHVSVERERFAVRR